jgi:hypothetical protein
MTKRRAAMAFASIVVLGLTAAIASCSGSNPLHFSFKDPSGEPIKAVVRTTVPLAYAASVAMSSVTGSKPTNAAFVYNNCTTTPTDCAAVITIDDDNSAWPLQFSSYGTITVYGYWISPDQAILTVAFGTGAGSSLFPVHDISVFPVLKTPTGFTIVYVNVDVDISTGPVDPATLTPEERLAKISLLNTQPSNDASANIKMDAWIIDVDNAGTQTFSDDTYRISGGGQYIEAGSGAGSILQLGLVDVSMGAGCALNPVLGLAAINEVGSSSSNVVDATALLSFGPSCDGNSMVMLATGNYLLAIGKSIPLNLTSP